MNPNSYRRMSRPRAIKPIATKAIEDPLIVKYNCSDCAKVNTFRATDMKERYGFVSFLYKNNYRCPECREIHAQISQAPAATIAEVK
jgi:hypothetical protein